MDKTLAQYFTLHRRYSRSINLERDLERVDSLAGYILTQRAQEALYRIGDKLGSSPNAAWTLTSVYGTGKSSFAHFLAALCAPVGHPMREKALAILLESSGSKDVQLLPFQENFPARGYVRAIATGTREPISHTIIRALNRGIEAFWNVKERNKINITARLVDLENEIISGNRIESRKIARLVLEVAKESKTGVFLILDELGKNLEFTIYNSSEEDLYLLQELSELSNDHKTPVYILGVLHQYFADYGQRLGNLQRNEWSKIQGRFEDIPFTESSGEMMRLIGQAIDSSQAEAIEMATHQHSQEWFDNLAHLFKNEELSFGIFKKVYPLHPLTALILPILCNRYAQNDRSLFTFLTSSEPLSFKNFSEETTIEEGNLFTLKLDRIYDYFIETAGMGLASRPNLQRWVEIQDLIADAKHLEVESLRVLKIIGVLNLVTTTGNTKATRELVKLAMSDIPADSEKWAIVVDDLLKKGLVTHFRQLDELRLWQGSDFNVDLALNTELERQRDSLVFLLSNIHSLVPLVAQRHSYQTGTLRYFERIYLDSSISLKELKCVSPNVDGLIGYWLDDQALVDIPETTIEGKPLIIISITNLSILHSQVREFSALKKIKQNAPELQTDSVARKEINYRLNKGRELLDETLNQSFNLSSEKNTCWILGKKVTVDHIRDFNLKLSEVCDQIYHKTPHLWNELINRRELTSQGTKARRELIQAMVEHPNEERLALEGYGPEVSMYFSLLKETKIHREEDGYWDIYPPAKESLVWTLWEAIETFCLDAKEKPETLDKLYQLLNAPPYGMKEGAIPVLLAAILLHYMDDIGVYKDGTFIPVLGVEHFELLVKDPSRFAVKNFEVIGLRSQVFKELEAILRHPNWKKPGQLRNATLLTVVSPLYQFVKKLPAYTKQTQRIGIDAQAVLKSLQETVEPDELLFIKLPIACNLPLIKADEEQNEEVAKNLKLKLIQVLREINTAYGSLLHDCQGLLYEAFGVRSDEQKLREDLRVRAKYLVDKCVERSLRSFTQAAIAENKTDEEWLEALVMIIADKPALSWKDEDFLSFEVNLSELARKFKNLEALQKNTAIQGDGFDARRITIIRPEYQRIVLFKRKRIHELKKS